MSEEQKKQLERQLWNIADTLRGKMHADEFRDYILGFIFYKYLSEKMLIKANALLKTEGIAYTDIDEGTEEGRELLKAIKQDSIQDIGYFLKPSELFSVMAKRGNSKSKESDDDSSMHGKSNFILWDLAKVLGNIQNSTMGTDSEDDFEDLFSDLDLTSQKLGKTEAQKNELIAKVLEHLDKIDFQINNAEADVLWDAYEYLIAQFASGAGKKAGEFYTPQEVSKVLAKIVTTGKKQIRSAYDPTCGSGSLLLRIAKEAEVWEFFGQELNRTTYNLARMNMILHGVHYSRFNIKQEDTLEHPQHLDKKFEAIVANPPFSAHWKANPLKMTDDRFSQYGKLAPATKADFAFVQHMIHHLDENGTMAVVLPHGALFRGGAERHIRKFLIEDRNYLDAVIGLPGNIFYGTSIPTCVLVFKKCRENPENVIFIDASGFFEKSGNQNVLRPLDITKLIETYQSRKIEKWYSYIASIQEIEGNDFNLNIARYVDTFWENWEIPIEAVAKKLKNLDSENQKLDIEIETICIELWILPPNWTNLSLLRQYKKWVSEKIFDLSVRFKDQTGLPFPNWTEKKLNDLTSIFDGTHMTPDYKDKGIPFYSVEHLTNDNFIETKFISAEVFEKENKRVRLEKWDILMTRIWDIGTSKYIDWDVRASFYVSLCLIKQNGAFNSQYLDQFIKSNFFQRELWKRTIHVAFPKKINLGEIWECMVRLPCIEEQGKIASFLSAIDKKIQNIWGASKG